MGERCKLPQWGPGLNAGDLAIFVDFGTQEVILQYSTLCRVQISINKRHTALLSTSHVLNSGGTNISTISEGGRVPLRDLRPYV